MDGPTLLLIRGIVGLVIGVLAFAWPGVTIAVLVGIFGVFAIVDGITNLMVGVSRRRPISHPWAHILQGIVGICAGVLTFLWPGLTALVLITLIGAWAIVTGVLEIVAAIRLRREITGEWLLALSGILSILFGLIVFAFPGLGAIGIAWTLAAYAVAAGITLIALGIRLRARRVAV
jgi:uncharacterized membrane protein HdeD (DUF308 family)